MTTKVEKLKMGRVVLTLVGDTPLISSKFPDRVIEYLILKDQNIKSKGHDKRDPEGEFHESLYVMPSADGETKYGFPAMAFKNAAIRAAKQFPGMTMVDTRCKFNVICKPHMLIPLRYSELKMGQDVGRIGNNVPHLIYRGYFLDWEVDLGIIYATELISIETLISLYDLAGFGVGVGAWRPEHNGVYGTFHVKKEGE